jgi:hypothetical protein
MLNARGEAVVAAGKPQCQDFAVQRGGLFPLPLGKAMGGSLFAGNQPPPCSIFFKKTLVKFFTMGQLLARFVEGKV